MLGILIWTVVLYVGATTNKFWPWGVVAIASFTGFLSLLKLWSWLFEPAPFFYNDAEVAARNSPATLIYSCLLAFVTVTIIFFVGFGIGAAVRWWRAR